jgi:hypothetical protein
LTLAEIAAIFDRLTILLPRDSTNMGPRQMRSRPLGCDLEIILVFGMIHGKKDMCADYYLIPITIADRYPWAMNQLDHYNMERPITSGAGRNPKPEEVREALDDLSDYSVVYSVSEVSWQADIRSRKGIPLFSQNSLLNLVDFSGDESFPHLVCLESGDIGLNLLIAERLSRIIGSLYIIADTGAQPLIVAPGSDLAELKRHWEI